MYCFILYQIMLCYALGKNNVRLIISLFWLSKHSIMKSFVQCVTNDLYVKLVLVPRFFYFHFFFNFVSFVFLNCIITSVDRKVCC